MERNIPPSKSPEIVTKQTVAELEGCQPSELGTLSEVVDIDELNSLGPPSPMETENETASIGFSYCGYTIEFNSNRTLSILP